LKEAVTKVAFNVKFHTRSAILDTGLTRNQLH